MAGFDADVFGAPAASGGFDADVFGAGAPASEPKTIPIKKKGTGSTTLDAGNAVGTGYFQGLTRLAGLPVDTVANVLDLGKAAIGAPYTAATGKPAPEWLQPADRKTVFGSGEYLLDKARKTDAGQVMLDAVNPDYQGGYLQLAGGALSGVMNPNTTQQAINQGINSVAGATAGKVVYDTTGSVPLAIAAGMSPTLVQKYGTDAVQYAVRGGEAGRQNMEQRILDLKNAGVSKPTLGLASGNKLIGGVENLLQNTPGAIKVMDRARESAVSGLQAKTQQAAELASNNRGTLEAGQAIQTGLNKDFRGDFKTRQAQLYDRMDQFIPGQTPVNVAGTKQTIRGLNSDIPGAPELSKQFKNSRIAAIQAAIDSDTQGTAPAVMTQTIGSGGLLNAPKVVTLPQRVPGGSSTDTLPFEAVKKTRTLVGNEIADSTIMSDVPRSKWNPLYGALSADMQKAAAQAGPGATKAFDRATDYTRAGIQRLERVGPFADAKTPEAAFRMYSRSAEDNLSTLQAVKKSLPEGARGSAAGTVIERLGKATNGMQNDTGSAWSPETFLTNWNKMTPATQSAMFSGFKNAAEVKAAVDNVARATSMMRDSSKMWANPSGSGANVAARGLLATVAGGGVAASAGLLNPVVPLAAAGGLLGTYGLARATTSPKVVNAMASKNYLDPELLQAQINSLVGGGLLEQR